MIKVSVTIHGISPLLQHSFPIVGSDVKRGSGKRVANADYSKEEFDALYINQKKEVYQPSSHIEGCLTKAATEFFIKGHKGKRYTDRVKAFIEVQPQQIIHKNQDWHADTRSVVVQRSRVVRRRPCFNDWSLDFEIVIKDPDAVPPETLHEILEYGGRYVGIGDYRPKFGLFEVTKWEVPESPAIKEDS
jgi:hypothetical protein